MTTTTEDNHASPHHHFGHAHLDDLDLPPFRIHRRFSAPSSPQVLLLQQPNKPKRFSLDLKKNKRSRSRSPSCSFSTTAGNSSVSSLEGLVDADILYDKAAFEELVDVHMTKKRNSLDTSATSTCLTPVSERLSEDTLADVHAFTDVVVTTRRSSGSTVGGGATDIPVLEPLNEQAEEQEHDVPVIVTNLENIAQRVNLI